MARKSRTQQENTMSEQTTPEMENTSLTEPEATEVRTQDSEVGSEQPEQLAPTEAPTSAPTQEPTPAPTKPPVVDTKVLSFKEALENIRQNGTLTQKLLVDSLDRYVSRMAPGIPIANDKAALEQQNLWRTIKTVAEGNPSEFRACWNIILGYFNEYEKSVFHDYYVFRATESLNMEKTDITAFQRILDLIKLTAKPETRDVGLKQVRIGDSVALSFSEEARQRILAFYGQ